MVDGRVARGQRTREAIIDATIELIREAGAAAVTHRAVAKRAGTSLAATTYHFSTLDDLLVESFELLTERSVAEIQRFAELVLSGRVGLVDAAVTYAQLLGADQGFGADGVLELAYGAIRNERLRKSTDHLLDQMSGQFAEYIGEGQARTLMKSLNGVVLHHQAMGPDVVTADELRADLTRLFDNFGLTGAVAARVNRLEEES